MKLSLNRNQLKYLALFAMVVDHIAWAFVPIASSAGQLMHFFGRLTGPIMAFFLAEGYLHTRSVWRYAFRLALFALISWPACSYFMLGKWFGAFFGVIYTLFLGLLAIIVYDRSSFPSWLKIVLIALLCLASYYGDWTGFDVLWPLCLVIYKDDPVEKWRRFFLITAIAAFFMLPYGWDNLFQVGVFVPALLLRFCYNGEPGSRRPFHKWFFYFFYPAHLLILDLLLIHRVVTPFSF